MFLPRFRNTETCAFRPVMDGDLRKIKGGLNLLKAGYPTLRQQLKVLKGG